jgi:hypothetical protein
VGFEHLLLFEHVLEKMGIKQKYIEIKYDLFTVFHLDAVALQLHRG